MRQPCPRKANVLGVEAMRRILIEHARRKQSLKHGGDRQRLDLDDAALTCGDDKFSDNLLALNDAFEKLSRKNKQKADVVRLRYFAGLTIEQTAEAYYLRALTAATIKETLDYLDKALDISRDHYESRRMRASTYHCSRKFSLAAEDALSLTIIRPRDSVGYVLRANALMELGRFEEAVDDFSKAIELTPWGEPVNLGPTVNTASFDARPILVADGLLLLFESEQPGGFGSADLYMMRRATVSDPWTEPVNLGPGVNSPASDEQAFLSPDGSTVYFHSNRPGGYGGYDIWQASVFSVSKAHKPDPADGAIYENTWATLSWSPGHTAVSHDLYFGDNFNDVKDGTEGTETEKGDVWAFSTLPVIPITDPNLSCWWKFDEDPGSTALDHSGHDRHGTLEGNARWVDGMVGAALEFDGTGDRVVDNAAAAYLNGLDAITVCMWIKSDVVGSDKGFINGEEPDGGDNVVTMRYDSAGANAGGANVFKIAVTSTEGEQQLESSNNAQTTDWQHVAMVWSSGQRLKFYINGVLDVPTDNEPATTGTIAGCTKLVVGAGAKDAGGGWDYEQR